MPTPPTQRRSSEVTFRELADAQMPPFHSLQPPEGAPHRRWTMSVGALSRPMLGLPLARWIPQDYHSFLDYANGLAVAGTAIATVDPRARIAGITLASIVIGMTAKADTRLAAIRFLPVEGHEVADYVWGAAAIAAPFVLGYWRRAPRVAVVHVVAGLTTILASLVTDYRAYSKRSQAPAR